MLKVIANNLVNLNFDISLLEALSLNLSLFIFSLLGIFLNKRNFLISLLCLEILFLSVSLNFVVFGFFLNNPLGFIYCLVAISLSAAETAIGLSLFVIAYRTTGKITFDSLISLRG